MTPAQYTAVQVLSAAAALSVLFFDKRGRAHKPVIALTAYLIFVQMAALSIAAVARYEWLVDWLLILGLAVHTGNLLLARGNVGKIHPQPPKPAAPGTTTRSKPRIHPKPEHNKAA